MPELLTLTTADGQLLSSVTIPTCLADVTLAQWITFVAPGSPEADSVMTGLSPEILSTLSEADRAHILGLLTFLSDATVLRELLPTPGSYDLGKYAYGLHRNVEEYFAAHMELTRLEQGAYLYCLFRDRQLAPFRPTPEQIAAAHAAVLARPVTEVYADCYHFADMWERFQNTPVDMSRFTQALDKATKPAGWLVKLGNLWNPTKRAVA